MVEPLPDLRGDLWRGVHQARAGLAGDTHGLSAAPLDAIAFREQFATRPPGFETDFGVQLEIRSNVKDGSEMRGSQRSIFNSCLSTDYHKMYRSEYTVTRGRLP